MRRTAPRLLRCRPRRARGSPLLSRDTWTTYGRLVHNKPYVLTVLGYAAYTFAVGGLAVWMPAFLERARGIPRSEATVSFGTIVVVTGFVGTFVGGWLGDYCAKYSRQAYLWLSAIATLVAAPFVWLALTTDIAHPLPGEHGVRRSLCLFLSTGPINAAIVNLVVADRAGHGDCAQRLRHSSARRRALAAPHRRAVGSFLLGAGRQDSCRSRCWSAACVWVWAAARRARRSRLVRQAR